MNTVRAYISPLRQEQTEATRRRIIEAALGLMAESPQSALSQEAIAERAGIALRTVYRHFPLRSELLDEVWQESDRRLGLIEYPDSEEAMLASVQRVFRRMDENAPLIRGLLHSDAGREMRQRDKERRRAAVAKALERATSHLPTEEQARVIGIFQVLFSGRTWETLRDRAGLPEGEAARAVEWAMQTLLASLHRDKSAAGGGIQATEARPGKAKKVSSRKR